MEVGQKLSVDCILFDLDDTLYPSTLGISKACRKNIEEFIAKKCDVNEERAAYLRVELFRSYGSSLAGLLALGYDVHPDEYHSFVHGRLPYENILPDPQLRDLLLQISQPKILFTNSDMKHAKKALHRLGIEEELFQNIVCFEMLNPHLFKINNTSTNVILKPAFSAFEAAIKVSGTNAHRTLFLDDSERNIVAGKALGLQTALVGKSVKIKEADYLVGEMLRLKQVIPEIWGGKQKTNHNMNDANEEHKSAKAIRNDLDSIKTATPVQA